MPLGLGLAVSHSPVYYRPREQWEEIYQRLVGEVPQDTRAEIETPEVLDDYETRLDAGFGTLKSALESYEPDALVIAMSDTGRVFGSAQVPQLSVFVGDEIWGTTHYAELGEQADETKKVTLKVHQPLAAWLVDELTEEAFDMNVQRFFKPLGEPENGAPHSLSDPYQRLAAELNLPVVPLFINSHLDPCITGHRMPPLGRAIARVLSERDERIAMLGVGGLSGDPHGYLAGWVDELMDDWVLSRLRRGRSEQLKTMWDVESITLRGATQSVRNWLVVGAAMEQLGAKANIVDYLRFHHAAVGTAFATWKPPSDAG
jgi:Catalytic LigB subunit of aromatic ring-opening dioxygenase